MAVLSLDNIRLPEHGEKYELTKKIDTIISYLNDVKLQLRYFSTNIGDGNINLKDIRLLEEHISKIISERGLKLSSKSVSVDGYSLEEYIIKVMNGG